VTARFFNSFCTILGISLAFLTSVSEAAPRREPVVLPTGPSPVQFYAEVVPQTWQWRWTVTNASGAPVEVLTDRRLVWAEMPAPPGEHVQVRRRGRRGRRIRAPQTIRCIHEMRPGNTDAAQRRRLAPGQSYSELVDLRDLCRLRIPAAMTPGTAVTLHYGLAPAVGRRGRSPSLSNWNARTILVDRRSYPVNDLVTHTVVPPGDVVARPVSNEQGVPPVLSVTVRDASAAMGGQLRATVRVRNESRRPVWTYWRTFLFAFEIQSPSGRQIHCDMGTRDPNAFRDFFVRLGSQRTRTSRLVVWDYCPLETFDESGLYTVRALFSSDANGEPWLRGDVFTGSVASVPFQLRVSRGRARYRPMGLRLSPPTGAR
jgi:hypothetical protein